LKRYRRDKAEQYARLVLETPPKISLLKAFPHPGLIMVMGDRRQGKSGLAHEAAHVLHEKKGIAGVVHLPTVPLAKRREISKLLPPYLKVVTKREDWPQDSVVIYDEAAQSAHARRSQSKGAVEMDDLIAMSGQRQQTIIFIAHHSRKLDLNIITEVNRLIWKKPTFAHQLFERDEVSDFTMRAFDFFRSLTPATQKKAALVLDLNNLAFGQVRNGLPPWWSDELSRLFQSNNGKNQNDGHEPKEEGEE
jgi:hypothetical protein